MAFSCLKVWFWSTRLGRSLTWLSYSDQKRQNSIERLYWLFSSVLSLGVAIGAGYSAYFAYQAASAGWEAAKQARIQAEAAEGQLTQSKAASRPYVVAHIREDRLFSNQLERVPVREGFLDTYTAKVRFANYGTTPAIIRHIEGRVILAEGGRSLNLPYNDYASKNDYTTDLVLSQGSSTTEYNWERDVDQKQKARLIIDNLRLYVSGKITYADVYGNLYNNTFCYFMPTHSHDLRTRIVPGYSSGCFDQSNQLGEPPARE